MNKTLSKSVIIMFLYDALIFGLSSYFWYAKFNLASKMLIPAVLLIVATGLFTLFLKANYKIREFNNTLKNCYLLFEGMIFSQIPAAILLAFFNLNFSLVSLDSQNENCRTQNANISILRLVRGKYSNFVCHTF